MKQATIDATKDALAKLIREDGPTPSAPSAEHMESLPSVKAIMQDPKKLAAAKAFADAIYGNK